MPSGVYYTSRTGLDAYSTQLQGDSLNLTAAGAVAGKKTDTFVLTLKDSFNTGGVETARGKYLSSVGAPIESAEKTHLSVTTQGWIPVSSVDGKTKGVTRNGTFEMRDNSGYYKNNQGHYLNVILTNPDGSPKTGAISDRNSYQLLNVNNLSMASKATDQASITLNLASDTLTAPIGNTFEDQSVILHDSTGVKRHLRCTWTRVGTPFQNAGAQNAWQLTINGPAGSTVNGSYATGMRIEFDGSGKAIAFDTQAGGTNVLTAPPLSIDWGGGAEPSLVTFDLSKVACTNNEFNIGNFSENGYQAGNFKKLRFNDQGVGTATFTNGQKQIICHIPLGICNNINGLETLPNGMYIPTNKSGEIIFNTAESGSFKAGYYEGSTSYTQVVLIDAIQHQKWFMANLDPIKKAEQMDDNLLALI